MCKSTKGQFHQCSTCSFYVRRSKKTDNFTLMKLTPRVIFIKFLQAAFKHTDTQRSKNSLTVFFHFCDLYVKKLRVER